ncbi:MAG: acyl carrier protein [Clostridia bacterium]
MEEKVINIICQAITLESDILITVDTLLSDLPFDSIKFIKMVVALESEFDFEFEDEKLLFTQFQTVKSLIEYVDLKVNSLNK